MSGQQWLGVLGALLVISPIGPDAQAAGLVQQSQARRCGLTRAWFAQVGSLQATGAVNHLHVADGVVLAQTTGGLLTAIDSESGRTQWAVQVGPRGRITTEAAANNQYVAVANGSTLYVLDRTDGRLLWRRRLGGAPGAGPAVSDTHAFVPMIDGRIEGYALDGSTKFAPWVYYSAGDVQIPPVTTPQTVSWTTERGHMCVADPHAGGIRYRLETNDSIHARAGYWTPNLYTGSKDGFVYAVDETDGTITWKFSVGDAIFEPPVPIGDKLFVVSQFRGMTCLDTNTASQLWVAPGIAQFLSASPARVYVLDKVGRLAVLDIHSGTRLAAMTLDDVSVKLTNSHSDRIFLASATGAVQCLHELGQSQPVTYIPPPAKKREFKVRVRDPQDPPPDAPPEPAPDGPQDDPFPPADDAPDAPAVFDADDPFATP